MRRTSSTLEPSGRLTIQSPPGATIVPLSLGPAKVPPETGTIRRPALTVLGGRVSSVRSSRDSDCSFSSSAAEADVAARSAGNFGQRPKCKGPAVPGGARKTWSGTPGWNRRPSPWQGADEDVHRDATGVKPLESEPLEEPANAAVVQADAA